MRTTLILPLALLTALACADAPAPSDLELPVALANAGNGVVLNARGSGHIRQNPQRTFTFNAKKKADGTVMGEGNLTIGSAAKIHADVTCISSDGQGRVWVGAVVTGGDTWPVGAKIAWTVIDNGKEPDVSSFWVWRTDLPDYDQLICDVQPTDFLMFPVERGNITITE